MLGCGKLFSYSYGQGESLWIKCGEKLNNPDEIALCCCCEKTFKRLDDFEPRKKGKLKGRKNIVKMRGSKHKWLFRGRKIEIDLHTDRHDGEQYIEVVTRAGLVRIWDDGQIVVEKMKDGIYQPIKNWKEMMK